MSVIFTENNKVLELSIDGYEYDYSPDDNTKPTDSYDSNWLTVRVDYSENGNSHTYKDNCLLTFELDSLSEDIDKIINGSESGLITDFLEPILKLSITAAGGLYAVQIRFVYDLSDVWRDVYISQTMTLDELRQLNEQIKEMAALFPVKNLREKIT